jgi:AcrR family transcriptional regulator
VPRVSRADRLDDVAAAATRVFGELGYRRTRTADVAAEAGLSPGAVFSYVESKEALFHLVFVAGFGSLDEVRGSLPLTAPPLEHTLELIRRGLDKRVAFPSLRTAERAQAPDDVRSELAGVVADMYDELSRNWPLLSAIERSAPDINGLDTVWFVGGRHDRLDVLERYLARRAAEGGLREMVDTAITARWLLETVVWFAWHRREDRDSQLYDEDITLATLTKLVCDALVTFPGDEDRPPGAVSP